MDRPRRRTSMPEAMLLWLHVPAIERGCSCCYGTGLSCAATQCAALTAQASLLAGCSAKPGWQCTGCRFEYKLQGSPRNPECMQKCTNISGSCNKCMLAHSFSDQHVISTALFCCTCGQAASTGFRRACCSHATLIKRKSQNIPEILHQIPS